MLFQKRSLPDGRPTMAEWPVKIWTENEFPSFSQKAVSEWIQEDFSNYHFVYSPKRKTDPSSYDYVFGYGNEAIIHLRENVEQVLQTALKKEQIRTITVKKELLHMCLCVQYEEAETLRELLFPYIASVYYLYDPFLNWMLGLDREFNLAEAEKASPRPEKLYKESLAMYNFSLNCYRLGNGFDDYRYRQETKPMKWMRWKKESREWLEISLERGLFQVYSAGYYKEFCYQLNKNVQ